MKKKGTINQFNIVGVVFQFIVTVVVVIFGILSLFNKSYYSTFELVIGVDLFIMAYNNQKIYQKKNLTIIYLLVGLFLVISSILKMIGVL